LRYTLKQLGYFVATGEAGSILQASENIHVSQPSISSAIAHLEQAFGVQLFVRHHAQGMSLTPSGRELLREAKALLTRADGLQGFAGELAGRIIGTIELGCFNPLAPIITQKLCHGFMQHHPETEINVREGHQADLLQLLRQGTIDIALTYDLQLQGDFQFEPLATLPPYVLIGADHPMASKPPISLKSMASEPMILLDLPLSSDYFMSLFHRLGLKPMIRARTRLTEVQRSLVACGHGYSLANVRPLNRTSLDGNALRYIRLQGEHPSLTLGVVTLANSRISMVTRAFIDNCRAQVSDRHIPGMTESLD
jgi:DNA-binding transcriptional LysR family regulator